MTEAPDPFAPHLARWRLAPDGAPFRSLSSDLLPVRYRGRPAMLKVTDQAEERYGAVLMAWWDGDGAARVLARDGDALLLERATGCRSLAAMARDGRDDEASRTLCAVAARLHAPRGRPRPDAIPLTVRFKALAPAARSHGGLLVRSAEAAQVLLTASEEPVLLHGDLHHGNVLDGGERGWLAIDPKRLHGERGFEFANIFRNPEPEVALRPGRLARQAHVVAEAADLDRARLLRWVLAWCGLSAVWSIQDGDEAAAAATLDVGRLAAAELGLGG
ncbi:aminoglycoside phosphotransferase family protein [Marinivivus vitaminiproducens]|uniref:aminoglycoside phosphotransferase family protein n=1 Tax=Marinivivus vitaminiproducens TaxID=3035935 RepID=UPI00279F3FE6|nr:aminoglycoside phosphotransferase family protein [Geminicoccaceae bacterium SCSIO 64248]